MNKLTVDEYMKLPYTKIFEEIEDETGHYFHGKILELDGCHTTADTLDEMYEDLKDVMRTHIEIKLKHNLPIPLPLPSDAFEWKNVESLKRLFNEE